MDRYRQGKEPIGSETVGRSPEMNPPHCKPRSKVADLTLIVSFSTVIVLPTLGRMAGFGAAELDENRVRATRPEFALQRDALAQYPAKFEAYFNDSFGFRDRLIRWNNVAKVLLLGVSHSPQVEIGRNGWLFFRAEGAVDDLRRSHPFSEDELQQWARTLEERRQWLAA